MAKQEGPLKLTGTIGNLTFFKNEFGYLAKHKGGPTRDQVLKSEQFENTRDNAADFKSAIEAGVLVRRVVRPLLKPVTSSQLNGRMNRVMLKIIQSDKVHPRGQKVINNSALSKLAGFEFSYKHSLPSRLRASYDTLVDSRKGALQVTVASFVPKRAIKAPKGATHFKIVSLAGAIDFEKNKYKTNSNYTPLQELNNKKLPAICWQYQLAAQPGQWLLLAIGIVFYKMIDGFEQRMKEGALKVVVMKQVAAPNKQ